MLFSNDNIAGRRGGGGHDDNDYDINHSAYILLPESFVYLPK
jgi:hypothetical protein